MWSEIIDECVEQAAIASGYSSLDEVSYKIFKQLQQQVPYTGSDLVQYVNYVVNMMLFSKAE